MKKLNTIKQKKEVEIQTKRQKLETYENNTINALKKCDELIDNNRKKQIVSSNITSRNKTKIEPKQNRMFYCHIRYF